MKQKENESYYDKQKSRRFRVYFQYSMIAVCFVLAFGIFRACQNSKGKLDPAEVEMIQYETPEDSAPVAVFETSEGTFKALLYPEETPKFCAYFTGLVNSGYYDGTHIFAVQENVYFMGGSKTQDGANDDASNTDQLEPELTPNLWPFAGALISYGDKGGSIFNRKVMSGSRILFVNTVDFNDEFNAELDSAGGNQELVDTFKRKGGVPNFSQQYTVFAQVYDGMDTYVKICNAPIQSEDNLRPTEDITITKVYMSTYGENKNDTFFDPNTTTYTPPQEDSSSEAESQAG